MAKTIQAKRVNTQAGAVDISVDQSCRTLKIMVIKLDVMPMSVKYLIGLIQNENY